MVGSINSAPIKGYRIFWRRRFLFFSPEISIKSVILPFLDFRYSNIFSAFSNWVALNWGQILARLETAGDELGWWIRDGSLIRPEIRKETTKQNHKRVMRSGSWIQATGPNNGHQLRDYSKSSNRSEIATPHKTTTMQEKNRESSPPITHIFASL